MTRIFTVLLLLLMAVAGWGATYTVGPGGTYASFTALFTADNDWSGDVINVTGSYTDKLAAVQLHNNTTACTINLGGYTVTFDSLAATAWAFRFNKGSGAGSIAWNNGTIVTTGYAFYMSNYADLTLTDVTIRSTGAGGTPALIFVTSVQSTTTLTNCSFSFATGSTAGILYVEGVAATTTVTGSTFSTCGTGISYNSTALGSGVTVTNSTFTNCGYSGISLQGGGSASITGCSFSCTSGLAGFTYSNRTGIAIATPAGTACDFVIDSCQFATNGGHGLRLAKAGNYDQGTGGDVIDCTFGPDSTYYYLGIQTNGVEVRGCTFYGGRNSSTHMLMLGMDDGTDLDQAARATGLLIHDNQWLIRTAPRTDGTSNFHNIVCKADGAKIYNNRFSFLTTVTNEPNPNVTQVYLKGADDCQIYNNEFHTVYTPVIPFKLGIQVANKCNGNKFYNNKLLNASTYDMVISDKDELGALEVANNLMGTAALKEDTGTAFTLKADSTWYSASNFADSTSWRMKWGGRGGLTGMTDSAQGFQAVGISTASPGQPAISRTQPGFRTPKESLESIRSIGALKGVELDAYIVTPQDRANLKLWQFAPHPIGTGTFQSVAGDTLQVRRVFQ